MALLQIVFAVSVYKRISFVFLQHQDAILPPSPLHAPEGPGVQRAQAACQVFAH